MKNSKKNVATNKKAYQAALIKKATAKKTNATPAVDSVNTDNISTTTDTAPVRKVNDKALQDALAYLLSNYPAIETTRKSDFKDVFNMLLKLNVDLSSKKDISAETERILNILGFTNNKHNVTKEFISKYDIPQLVTFMFNGYQEKHPDFCKIEPSVLLKCSNELNAISQKFWHPIVMYIAYINASRMDSNNASKLLSSNEAEIKSVFHNEKYIGMILKTQGKGGYELRLYNKSGKVVLSKEFKGDYSHVKLCGNQVIMYDGKNCSIFMKNGIQKFKGRMDNNILEMFPVGGVNQYIVLSANGMEKVRLVK